MTGDKERRKAQRVSLKIRLRRAERVIDRHVETIDKLESDLEAERTAHGNTARQLESMAGAAMRRSTYAA